MSFQSFSFSGRSEGGRSPRATPTAASYRSRTAKVSGIRPIKLSEDSGGWAGAVLGVREAAGPRLMVAEGPRSGSRGGGFTEAWHFWRSSGGPLLSFRLHKPHLCPVVQQAKAPKPQGAGDAEEEEDEE